MVVFGGGGGLLLLFVVIVVVVVALLLLVLEHMGCERKLRRVGKVQHRERVTRQRKSLAKAGFLNAVHIELWRDGGVPFLQKRMELPSPFIASFLSMILQLSPLEPSLRNPSCFRTLCTLPCRNLSSSSLSSTSGTGESSQHPRPKTFCDSCAGRGPPEAVQDHWNSQML